MRGHSFDVVLHRTSYFIVKLPAAVLSFSLSRRPAFFSLDDRFLHNRWCAPTIVIYKHPVCFLHFLSSCVYSFTSSCTITASTPIADKVSFTHPPILLWWDLVSSTLYYFFVQIHPTFRRSLAFLIPSNSIHPSQAHPFCAHPLRTDRPGIIFPCISDRHWCCLFMTLFCNITCCLDLPRAELKCNTVLHKPSSHPFTQLFLLQPCYDRNISDSSNKSW